jgi:hypothetical protein
VTSASNAGKCAALTLGALEELTRYSCAHPFTKKLVELSFRPKEPASHSRRACPADALNSRFWKILSRGQKLQNPANSLKAFRI